jgi:formamidopyrimidine-DNA glycosylase
MPELPEVETVRCQLSAILTGRRIEASGAWLPRIMRPSVGAFDAVTCGQRILSVERRGKQLYFPLENGSYLLLHLGMTGRLTTSCANGFQAVADQHARAWIRLDDGGHLVYHDVRTFGRIGVALDDTFLTRLARDPLDPNFGAAALAQKLARRAITLKQALLEQHVVSGIGSIYADETCFAAGVHPLARPCDLDGEQLQQLTRHMTPVLLRAVAAGGTSLDRLYLTPSGLSTEYYPTVYGRAGQACPNGCGGTIHKTKLGRMPRARPVYFCAGCQPNPPRSMVALV